MNDELKRKELVKSFLEQHNISHQWFDHAAVFTCAESELISAHIPGRESKNLFLRNNKGDRHALVCVPAEKKVDLKALAKEIGFVGIGFASPERLQRCLDLKPGSVTLLGVLNDHDRMVEFYIDEEVWAAGIIRCHPLINTATVAMSCAMLSALFQAKERSFICRPVPSAV